MIFMYPGNMISLGATTYFNSLYGDYSKKREKKRVVIVGGGFAGLNFARQMFNSSYYEVTLVDKNNYNFFTPLLYQVATGFLDPSSIAYPFRTMFKNKDITFRMASVERVKTSASRLVLSDGGELGYDLLVFAAGSRTNFFGNESARQRSFTLKGIDDALHMRNEMVKVLEKATVEPDPEERRKLLTVVIAGGGATGVEIAGMLAEMRKYILGLDYPKLKNEKTDIYVIDGSPYLLAPMSEKTHEAAYRALEKMKVRIKLNLHVVLFENDRVHLSDGEIIESRSLIWAAGVIANTFEGISEQSLGKRRRMIVDQYNKVQGYENIYAIGDICVQSGDPAYPDGHPQLAQPAKQQGRRLALNLIAMAKGKQMKAFKYFDRGDMAIIGRTVAVADLFKHKLHLGGLLALISWLFIHVISLVNYNNKIKTLYNWAVAYATKDQALRMIFRSQNRETRL